MKTGHTVMVLAVMLSINSANGSNSYDFSRYQVILDREPFGAVPIAPPPEEVTGDRMADKPPPFMKSLRMCAITETEDFGLRVGIVNLGVKPPESYLMSVGEVQSGIELVDADFDREGALLKKDGLMHWIYLDGSVGSGAGGAHTTAAPPARGAPRVTASMAAESATGRSSYAERLKKRRAILEERRRKSEERESLGPEALKKQLQEYQMELIRAGGELGPPLPIPLTKEMDDKLVAEGALPPLE